MTNAGVFLFWAVASNKSAISVFVAQSASFAPCNCEPLRGIVCSRVERAPEASMRRVRSLGYLPQRTAASPQRLRCRLPLTRPLRRPCSRCTLSSHLQRQRRRCSLPAAQQWRLLAGQVRSASTTGEMLHAGVAMCAQWLRCANSAISARCPA